MRNAFWMSWSGCLALMGMLSAGCASLGRLVGGQDVQQPVIVVSSPVEPRWTSTTWESAATPQHRRILERAQVRTVTGEVVDVSCFLQLGKRGEAHVPCGQKCVRNGQPVGILTDEGRLYLVIPEEHHPRRDGQVSIKERFADLMAKRVQVSGMATEYKDYRAIFVRTLPEEQTTQP